MSARESFVYGAAVLLSASIFNRIIGFIYQIWMVRLIKPEGIGLFNMVFPVYIMLQVLASLGIPVALAKYVAEEKARGNRAAVQRILRQSLIIVIAANLVVYLLFLSLLPWLRSCILPNPDAYLCLLALLPGVFIVSLCSVFRGYFQGLSRMEPTALTQMAEQVVRVCTGLAAAYLLLPRGVVYAALGLAAGVVCGELCGLGLMIYIYLSRRSGRPSNITAPAAGLWHGARRLLGLGIPVTLSRVVATAILSVEALLIPSCLQWSGLSTDAATAVYGQLVGIAEALLFTPGVITIALATALLPAISEAAATGQWRVLSQRAGEAVRLTIVFGAPAAVFFLMLPRELCGVLFGYPDAGYALQILAFCGPFLYLQQTFTGMLQGLGRADLPFRNLLLASAWKLIGIVLLTPVLQIQGAAAAISGALILNSLLNYLALKKLLHWPTPLLRQGQKPFLAGLAAAAAIHLVKSLLWPLLTAHPALNLSTALLAGSLVYLLVLLLTGGLTPGELARYASLLRRR